MLYSKRRWRNIRNPPATGRAGMDGSAKGPSNPPACCQRCDYYLIVNCSTMNKIDFGCPPKLKDKHLYDFPCCDHVADVAEYHKYMEH